LKYGAWNQGPKNKIEEIINKMQMDAVVLMETKQQQQRRVQK
jgi:hypothetical protein